MKLRPDQKVLHGQCKQCHRDRWLNKDNLCWQCAGPARELAEGIVQVDLDHPQAFDALFGLLGDD